MRLSECLNFQKSKANRFRETGLDYSDALLRRSQEVLSDDVVDYAEDPQEIIAEVARVLVPSGMFYFTVNICDPVWSVLSRLRPAEDFHTTHISLARARRFFKYSPLCIVWQNHDITANRVAIRKRRERRFSACVKSIFYYKARLVIIALREPF